MKILEMQPDSFTPKFSQSKEKREDFETEPHPYGFYHYPDSIKEKTAVNRLKRAMIKYREKMIEDLKQEIKTIKGVKYVAN